VQLDGEGAGALPVQLWDDSSVTPPLAAVPDLERELDSLYGLPLDEFTKARNDLAARLKRAHQAEAADAIKALKKPTLAAWWANQLARDEPKLVRALLDAAAALRETQQRSLAGRAAASDVTAAAAREREAIRALVAAARGLPAPPTAATLERLGQTLQAAAVDDIGRDLLERGRLTEELHAVGFGPLEVVRAAPAARRRDEVAKAAKQRVTALRAAARTLDAEARAAEQAAWEAERSAQILRDEATQRRADAARAAEELAHAETSLRSRG
jgi:hypothetical protein